MNDYHKLAAWTNVLTPKALKGLSSCKTNPFFPEKRLGSLFLSFYKRTNPIIKFFVTDKTRERVSKMDLSNCPCYSLSYLQEKFYKENGLVFFEDGLHFLYSICSGQVVMFVLRGEAKKNSYYQNGDVSLSWIVGGAVIPFGEKEPCLTANNDIDRIIAICNKKYPLEGLDVEGQLRIRAILKMIKRDWPGEGVPVNLTEIIKKDGRYDRIINDREQRLKDIWTCIRAFVFLKTAQTIKETFIPTDGSVEREFKKSDYGTKGVIKVDSFYDTEINIDSPFSVRGHFRNQPKKNEKGKWYKEVIYIDSFLKSGYHRKATKDKLEDDVV